MLSVKEIMEKFEVTRTTLHNWKTTKPKLYDYLINYDGANGEYRDIMIILDKFVSNREGEFSYEEIEFLQTLNWNNLIVEDIDRLHEYYASMIAKDLKQNTTFLLGIYSKIEQLSSIERWVFVQRLKKVKSKKFQNENKKELISHFFKGYLNGNKIII